MKVLEIITQLKINRVVPQLEGANLKLVGEIKNLSKDLIEHIKNNKAELISFLRNSMDQAAYAPIPSIEHQDYYPTSNGQKRLWTLSQFEGGTAAYNIVTSFLLKGTVIGENLNKAFKASIKRHESLRTVFKEIDGDPKQIVLDVMPFEIEIEDISSIPDVRGYLIEKIENSSNNKFDLENGPLIKVTLCKLSDKEYALIFGMHHIVSDGWSIGVMIQEVMHVYECFCKDEPPVIAPLEIHYKEYTDWLSEKIDGVKGINAMNYWKNEFAAVVDPLILPSDFERPVMKSFEGAASKYYIENDIHDEINRFCKLNHFTPFNFFRATLIILLAKLSGQDKIVIGIPVSGRSHFSLENQIGLYVNTIPLSTEVEADYSFLEFIAKVSEDSFKAFEHQEYPLDKIIEDLNVTRDSSRNPLFDVMMVLQNTALGDGTINLSKQYGFEISLLNKFLYDSRESAHEKRASKFDLTFNFDQEPDGKFYLEIEYSTKLFKQNTINKFFDTYLNIIAQVILEPQRIIREIQTVDENERNLILNHFNQPVEEIDELNIMELLEESFQLHQEKTAIIYDKTVISYGQLESYIQGLTAFLLPLIDLNESRFVGLLLDRSEWTMISILGIINAGAAYVPIDINYPLSRVKYIIDDVKLNIILTDEKGLHLIPDDYNGLVININDLSEIVNGKVNPVLSVPGNLKEETAYLIYTSGSTGLPKGVEICHRNVIAFLKWAKKEFAATPFEILYSTTSYCFDLSVFEFFLPLILGKRIRLLNSALDILEFVGSDEKIMINTVPSVIRTLLEQNMSFKTVAAINIAGEIVPGWMKESLDYSAIETRNLYGPSEDTTYSTVYRFKDDDHRHVPIGNPVGYTQLYILDRHQNLVQVGVKGEICLSGQSVAKGYLNRPELTADKFVENPFLPGRKMYRTGDTGKWLHDGSVEFISRLDDQVKVRGYRIEPGEIQYLLEQHELVKQAVIVIRQIDDENQIIAYCTGSDELTVNLLKDYLSGSLPAYMIPAFFFLMDKIPLNNNGKVDKQALPSPLNNSGPDTELLAPVNDLQFKLLAIWETVLNRDQFGITHNFFDLGGHSLKAIRLRSLVARELESDLTLNEIFLFPTVEKQAAIIDTKLKIPQLKIQKVKEQIDYPISYAQERLWILTNFEEASKAYHMAAAFRVNGNLDLEIFTAAFNQVIERHESLRTVFSEREGQPVQIILAPDKVRFEIETINARHISSVEEEHELLQKRWLTGFDLTVGPLLNCFLLHTANGDILSFNMHHIISDGWSIDVLYSNVIEVYKRLLKGQTQKLPPLDLQYRDFAVWQRNELTSEKLDKYKTFWSNIFKDGIPVLELPTDFHRPEIKTYNTSVYRLQFDQTLKKDIGQLASHSGVSLFMVLMAGINVLMKKYANQNEIIIGIPVAGREQQQLEDQIGFYINTLAIKTNIDGNDTFKALLSQQRNTMLEAFDHQNLPFEMLIDELKVNRDFSRSPLFDVMVVFKNTDGSDDELKFITQDLQLIKLPVESGIGKYDLTFSFIENAALLSLEVEYNTDLFKMDTIERMAGHLILLLEQVAGNAAIRIKDINLLSDKESEILMAKADQTSTGFDHSLNIISLFQRSAAAYPDKTALVSGTKNLSYNELDIKSGQLAKILMDRYEVQPEDLVLLHFERTEWMIISILAVLKSGAAYVPIDPTYPASRIDYIIEDTGSNLLLFDVSPDDRTGMKWKDKAFLDVTDLDYSGDVAQAVISPDYLAYVIYTSGTTGNPKGVLIEHRNVSRLLFNENNLFDFNSSDRWPLFHSYCFDVSVWEMYGCLLNGGTLIMVPKEVTQNSIEFYSFLLSENITVLNQTPTAFRSLAQNNRDRFYSEPVKMIRYLIFAGEALMPEILKDWNKALPDCKLINMYGITETTVHVTYKEISTEEINENKSNIGIPLPTLSCYVLDGDLQQVPVGIIGELCVGGAGVARGYLNKPDLTAERFIPDSVGHSDRLYRSGDYARILPSGDIEYIGRKDDQVKIRGHRIEIAEVESAVTKLEGVSDAVVIKSKNSGGEYDLIAYFIAAENFEISVLRNWLNNVLPSYMVPSFLIRLPSFPLNRNGKLDKEALPKAEDVFQRASAYVPFRHDIDKQIIGIWETVLERNNIGIKDDFFELGGHSLKATRVISKIHEVYGVRIDLKNLFINPTIEHLSDYVETIQWMGNKDEAILNSEDEIIF